VLPLLLQVVILYSVTGQLNVLSLSTRPTFVFQISGRFKVVSLWFDDDCMVSLPDVLGCVAFPGPTRDTPPGLLVHTGPHGSAVFT